MFEDGNGSGKGGICTFVRSVLELDADADAAGRAEDGAIEEVLVKFDRAVLTFEWSRDAA